MFGLRTLALGVAAVAEVALPVAVVLAQIEAALTLALDVVLLALVAAGVARGLFRNNGLERTRYRAVIARPAFER